MSPAQLDSLALLFLNKRLATHILDVISIFLADPRPFLPPLIILWLYLFAKGNSTLRISLIALVLVVGTTDILSSHILKPLIGRARPCQLLMLRLPLECSASFACPSSHAANISAFAGFIIALRTRWAFFLIPLIIIVSLTRVYAGLHWPSDILLGWSVGFTMALLFYRGSRKLVELKERRREKRKAK